MAKVTGKRNYIPSSADNEIFEHTPRTVLSKDDFFYNKRAVIARANPRLHAGMYVGPADLMEKKRELLNNIPECLKPKE